MMMAVRIASHMRVFICSEWSRGTDPLGKRCVQIDMLAGCMGRRDDWRSEKRELHEGERKEGSQDRKGVSLPLKNEV